MNDQILEILKLSKFTKRADLRSQLIARGFYVTDRRLRVTVEKMITEDHYGISSSEAGYSLIRTKEDLDEAVRYLKSKAFALLNRADSLEENFQIGKLSNQLTMFNG